MDWLLWQLADSAFPGGSLAHSGGLEAAYQHGFITGRSQLTEFLDAQLRSIARSVAPFALSARKDETSWADADIACDVFLTNHVANRASRAQGGAFLGATERVFRINRLSELRRRVREERMPGHFAPIFGVATLAMDIDAAGTCRLLLFLAARGVISSAVRLGIVGPLEGQSIQHEAGDNIDHWAVVAQATSVEDAAQTSPVLDLLQATQDRLYSRLFQS